jgi:D-psicose/D-tagatose/L-ribulose 3-epimerase
MNTLGVHAFVWVGGWSHEECDRAIHKTVEAGYDLLEITAMDPTLIDIEYTRDALNRSGLKASVSLGLSTQTDINSENRETVKAGHQMLTDALDVVQGIGSNYLCGVIYSALTKYPGPTTEAAKANSVAVLKEIAQDAAGRQISLGLEFVNRYETNLINTVGETLCFMDAIDEQNVFVHADTYHMNIEESDFRSPILLCADRLGYVHIGESNRGYLGAGTVDFDTFFATLREIGYQGPVTFESFSSTVVGPKLSNALGVWRDLWTDSMDLAVSAREFMAARLDS